jgi:hypothetical protein
MKLNKTAEEWAARVPVDYLWLQAQEDIATLHAEIERIHAEYFSMASAFLAATKGWQPMSTAPKDGREILARGLAEGQYVHFVVWHARDRWWDGQGYEYVESNDQWHEIPA